MHTRRNTDEYRGAALEEVRLGRGIFEMGSQGGDPLAHPDERPARRVEVSDFSCMVYPVTRALYAEVMDSDPGWPISGPSTLPVNGVTWFDAIEFCNRLSDRESLEPCYGIDQDGSAIWNRAADGYRLPTEAEWEYACRAGTQSDWYFGGDPAKLGIYTWFQENSNGEPHPVGQKKPNDWGLHDMHGNVWEWCWDWYGLYPQSPGDPITPDPQGPSMAEAPLIQVLDPEEAKLVNAKAKSLRGGSFAYTAKNLRSAVRFRVLPTGQGRFIGFRCVRGVVS